MKVNLSNKGGILHTFLIVIAMAAVAFMAPVDVCSQPYCRVRTFTIADGLAANSISEVSQSADGMMWAATWNGLCCYDGYAFNSFRDKPGAAQVLTSNRIKFIRPNSCGDIWLTTYDGHAYLFDRSTHTFIDIDKAIAKVYPRKFVTRNIISLGNGAAWLLGNGNVNFRIDEGKIKTGGGITLFDAHTTGFKGHVRKVVADGQGREWIFIGRGVALYGSRVRLRQPFEYMCDEGGRVFFASPGGTFAVYSAKSRQHMVRLSLPGPIGRINRMKRAGGGTIAIATDKGVVLYDSRSGASRLVTVAPGGKPQAVTAIFADGRRRVWAFTSAPGVSLVNTADGSVTYLKTEPPGLMGTGAKLPVVHEDGNGVVWVVPTGGTFSYFDEDKQALVPYNLNAGITMRMPVKTIAKYTGDRQGNLWFTGDHNITLVSFKFHRFMFTPSVPGDDTRSVACDDGGNVWTGTISGCLTVHQAAGGGLRYVSGDGRVTPEPVRFSAKGVYAIHQDRRGTMWIGTKGDGIYTLTPAKERYIVRHYTHSGADPHSLSSDNIYDFMEEPGGRLWVATYGGGLNIAVVKAGGAVSFVNASSGLRPFKSAGFNNIRKLTMTDRGTVIASTTGGMVTFDAEFASPGKINYYYSTHVQGDTASLWAPDVLDAYVCRGSGTVYVATMGGGLQKTDASRLLHDGVRFTSVEGFNAGEGMALSMLEDAKGNLWIVRESTIDMLNRKSGEIEVYGPNYWDSDVEFTEAKPCTRLDGGEMIIGIVGGYMHFRPGSIRKSTYKPSIVFSGVRYQGEQQITPLTGDGTLEVEPGRRGLTVYFAALDYSDNRLIRYAYRIKELDGQWSYTGTERSAPLGRIPPGRYTLEVRSTNADGVWTDNTRALTIHVVPTFWESGWAWLIYLLAASCVAYALMYVWRLRQKAKMERRMKEAQLSFFTDISHRLRTPLTLIGGPVGQVLDEEPLSVKARTYLEFVKKNAARMLELVDKSLDLDKLNGLNSELEAQARADLSAEPAAGEPAADGMPGGRIADCRGVKILVVEDNDELRYFLTSSLSPDYGVAEACNGKEGLDMAKAMQPDFIITDIMMPVMDGMEMIRRIKADGQICHIPIIVLTARTALDSRIEGLNEGIDDYITKPFSVAYLKTRVANIIRQRRMLQQAWLDKLKERGAGEAVIQMGDVAQDGSDREFTDGLLRFIEAHMADSGLKIDDIARAMAVSRTVLYGKVKTLSGMSPLDFVRHVRLLKAEKLVAETKMTLAEIAYATGFTDPKYFSRTFKQKTGLTPSEYRKGRAAGDNV